MRTLFKITLLVAALLVLYVASAVVYLPAVAWHGGHAPRSSALMEIREREAAVEGEDFEVRHAWVPLDSISPHLMHAVLAAEDTRFYEHRGFDWGQIREAWEASRSGNPLRGASTVTQQTVKNLYLSPSRNVLRKAREALLTVAMEAWLPKDRILELYLNVVELGPGIFGAEAASRAYFGRSAARLTRAQAALLAATLPAPLARNPGRPTAALHRRQRMILSRMSRWYEGPLLAEEEADDPPSAERRDAEPIELNGLDEENEREDGVGADAGPPVEETGPVDGAEPSDEAGPRDAEPAPAPADTSVN